VLAGAARLADIVQASAAPTLPALLQYEAARDVVEEAAHRGDGDYVPQYAGESLGLVHDLPSAAEVVRRIVEEAEAALWPPRRRLGRPERGRLTAAPYS
jgi:hypothetical protein